MYYNQLSSPVFKRRCERKADYLVIHMPTPTMLIAGNRANLVPPESSSFINVDRVDGFIHKDSIKSALTARSPPPPRTKPSYSLVLFAIAN